MIQFYEIMFTSLDIRNKIFRNMNNQTKIHADSAKKNFSRKSIIGTQKHI